MIPSRYDYYNSPYYSSDPGRVRRSPYRRKGAKSDMRRALIESLTVYYYHCAWEGCSFTAGRQYDMIEHYRYCHNFSDTVIPPDPKHQYDIEYILLEYLVEKHEQAKSKRYIRVSNKELWKNLVDSLGLQLDDKDAPSNQTPRHVLNALGLLTKIKGQRGKQLGYDSSGNRVYHINTKRLKEAVNITEYDNLKFRCGLVVDRFIPDILLSVGKPPSPTSEKSQNTEKDTDETEWSDNF